MFDKIEGTSPRGVVTLSFMDTDGVDGEGDGGRGTNSGRACIKLMSDVR